MKRVLTTAAAISLLALAATSSGVAATITTSCPSTASLIAAISFTVSDEPVAGRYGNIWATADYTRTVAVYRVTKGSFCAAWRDTGMFTTLDGMSPGGGGTVAAGISGPFVRSGVTTVFSGTWDPNGPTSGFIGGLASGGDWTTLYFDSVSGLGAVWWAGIYQTAANGCWANRTGYPSLGDIRTA
jgi:hypothetical protein